MTRLAAKHTYEDERRKANDTETRVRTRARPAPATSAPTPAKATKGKKPTVHMIEFAEIAFTANKEVNAAARVCNNAKKKLEPMMVQGGVLRFEFEGTTETGVKVPAVAEIVASDENYVDVAALKKIVGEAKFMEIVKATKEAVVAAVGENIYNACVRTRTKDPALKIGEKK